jgi:putative heme iron utilization protein
MSEAETDPATAARWLVRSLDRAALATATAAGAWPYASLVIVACDHRARPLLLISQLAEHTQNLATDGRASLLFDGTAGLVSPLTGSRVTVLGTLVKCDDGRMLARFIARHPDAADYAGFADFSLYRMAVTRAHLVAGFGAIHWIAAEDLLFDDGDFGALAVAEADIVEHMNADHAAAVAGYANRLAKRRGRGWILTGIDPEGCDLRRRGDVARLEFECPVGDAAEARAALVALAKPARAADKSGK